MTKSSFKYLLIFLFFVPYAAYSMDEFSTSYNTPYHHINNNEYCNIINFVKICGDISLLNQELLEKGYTNKYSSFITSMELKKIFGKQSLSKDSFSYLEGSHELSKIWNNLLASQLKYITNDFFIDSRVKDSFYKLFPQFPILKKNDIWIDIIINKDKSIEKTYTNRYREICNLVDSNVPLDKCIFLTHIQYLHDTATFSMWINSFLYYERFKLISNGNVIIVNNSSKESPSVDRVGNLYITQDHIDKYSSQSKIFMGILRHEAAHAGYFYKSLLSSGTSVPVHSFESNGAKADMNGYLNMLNKLFSERDYHTELMVDLHAISELEDENHDSYIKALEKYAPGEIDRIDLALSAIKYKSKGQSPYDMVAYSLYKKFTSSLKSNTKTYFPNINDKSEYSMINSGFSSFIKDYHEKENELVLEKFAEIYLEMATNSQEFVAYENESDAPSEEEKEEFEQESLDISKEIMNTNSSKIKSIFSK